LMELDTCPKDLSYGVAWLVRSPLASPKICSIRLMAFASCLLGCANRITSSV
jgi:hypothetical protein